MLAAYDFFICNAESYNAADYSLWEKEEMRHSAYTDKIFVVLSADPHCFKADLLYYIGLLLCLEKMLQFRIKQNS